MNKGRCICMSLPWVDDGSDCVKCTVVAFEHQQSITCMCVRLFLFLSIRRTSVLWTGSGTRSTSSVSSASVTWALRRDSTLREDASTALVRGGTGPCTFTCTASMEVLPASPCGMLSVWSAVSTTLTVLAVVQMCSAQSLLSGQSDYVWYQFSEVLCVVNSCISDAWLWLSIDRQLWTAQVPLSYIAVRTHWLVWVPLSVIVEQQVRMWLKLPL